MNLLLDTHIFLWSLLEPKKIPKKLKISILDPESTSFISVVTFWEISLKFSLGKIDLKGIMPDRLPEIARNDGFEILNLGQDVTSSFYKLPVLKNKDPFDRMLAWQAIESKYTLVTQDKSFNEYKKHGLKIYPPTS